MDISSKRGKNKLHKHKDRHITRTLSLLNKLWSMANKDNASYQQVRDAVQSHIELMAYLSPKLQAVAMGELDDAGNLNPIKVRQLADQVELELEERKLLPKANVNDNATLYNDDNVDNSVTNTVIPDTLDSTT